MGYITAKEKHPTLVKLAIVTIAVIVLVTPFALKLKANHEASLVVVETYSRETIPELYSTVRKLLPTIATNPEHKLTLDGCICSDSYDPNKLSRALECDFVEEIKKKYNYQINTTCPSFTLRAKQINREYYCIDL